MKNTKPEPRPYMVTNKFSDGSVLKVLYINGSNYSMSFTKEMVTTQAKKSAKWD